MKFNKIVPIFDKIRGEYDADVPIDILEFYIAQQVGIDKYKIDNVIQTLERLKMIKRLSPGTIHIIYNNGVKK